MLKAHPRLQQVVLTNKSKPISCSDIAFFFAYLLYLLLSSVLPGVAPRLRTRRPNRKPNLISSSHAIIYVPLVTVTGSLSVLYAPTNNRLRFTLQRRVPLATRRASARRQIESNLIRLNQPSSDYDYNKIRSTSTLHQSTTINAGPLPLYCSEVTGRILCFESGQCTIPTYCLAEKIRRHCTETGLTIRQD